MLILEILLIVDLFLWFLSLIPVPQASQFAWASAWLAWIGMLLLTLILFSAGSHAAELMR